MGNFLGINLMLRKEKASKPGASQRNLSLGKIPHGSDKLMTAYLEGGTGAEMMGSVVHTLTRGSYLHRRLAFCSDVNLTADPPGRFGVPGPLYSSSPWATLSKSYFLPFHHLLFNWPNGVASSFNPRCPWQVGELALRS